MPQASRLARWRPGDFCLPMDATPNTPEASSPTAKPQGSLFTLANYMKPLFFCVERSLNHVVPLDLAKRSGPLKPQLATHPTLPKHKSRSAATPCFAKHAPLFTRRTHPAKQAAQAAICRSMNVIPQPRKSHPANKRRFDVSQTLLRKRTPICCSMNVTLKTNGDLLQFSDTPSSSPIRARL